MCFRAKSSTLSSGKDGVKSEYKVRDSAVISYNVATLANIFFISFVYFRYNTWEPEENILDVRLIELYEESQRGGDVSTRRPRRRDTRYSVRTNNIRTNINHYV